MGPDARVGIYYCPREDDALFAAGAAWLGRDPARGAQMSQPQIAGIEEVTAEARSYGFHATLKPPMRLASGCSWNELLAATHRLAERIAPFELPPLAVMDLHGFLALRETEPCAPLQALADACVEALDSYRAAPSEMELARRRRAQLTETQAAMLVRFGYPYVLETWFFHMTLTRRLAPDEHRIWRPPAEQFFAAATASTRQVTDVCLFTQTRPGAAFVIAARVALKGRLNPRPIDLNGIKKEN
jgi:putative phosphonate metabolism protein